MRDLLTYIYMHVMEVIVTLAIILIASTKITSESLCPAEKCEYDIKPLDQYSQFDMHGEPLETRTRLITVEKSNSTGCYINTTDVVENFSFTEEPLVAILLLSCRQNILVNFTPFDQPKHNNAIGYLQIAACNLNYENIEQFSRVMDVRVIDLINNQLSEPCEDTPTECQGLQATAALTYHNFRSPPENITTIFSCTNIFPELAEVSFWNMSWSELPSFVQERLINLQALEVPYSNFTVPPYFPWRKEEHKLPRNLSRTRYFQNHYSEVYGLDIPANIFRRYFNLDYNKISDLRNFSFHGYLHMLTIKRNHLVHVGVETFRNVSGLQHLDLSENELKQIPMGIFDGLVTLRYLKLQINKIQELGTGIFDDLQSLTYLNVANNSISLLQKGLFARLGKLEVLYLEYNNISVIETEAFPVDSIALKSVYLNNNPLLSMPEFIFWIRSLSLVDLRSTLISFRTFGDFLDSIDIFRLAETVIESASSSDIDIEKKGEKFRLIDMTNAKVENIYVQNMTLLRQKKLILMIQNYHFKLDGNPLSCSCNIIPFHRFIYDLLNNKTIKGDEYYFTDWKCESPIELRGRRMLDVKPEETYCPINVSGCPKDCSCYKRSVNMNIIVDCRGRNLSDLHYVMPHGNLELWYIGNKIKALNNMNYLGSVKLMDLSDNSISKLDIAAIENLKNVKKLYLHSNLLAYLPKYIADIRFELLTLKHNPFKCDCHSLWMKYWMVKRQDIIVDWSDAKCNDGKENGRHFFLVPDDDFVCEEDFDSFRHVIIPTVTSTVILFSVISIIVIVYTYRLECKVLIYIYFGAHPFDKDRANKDEVIDAVIVHSGKLTDWVMDHIVNVLEGRNYNFHICDMDRDFVIGFTFQENLNQVVRHSKRMIVLISEDWKTDDETFKVAWNIAQEKIKESKSNFGIIISHGVTSKEIKDKALLRFMQRGRYIDSKHKLFVEKILYSMPIKDEHVQERKPNTRSLIQREFSIHEKEVDDNRIHAFLSYSDVDQEFVTNELAPELEKIGYSLCLPDRDFIPGASKEENILKAIDVSLRTVFVLSGSHIKDEWSLFTFITACEKTLREKTNYLIVIVREDVDLATMDEEVKHYLKTYISLHVNDRWFWSKLLNGLPPNGRKYDNGHTSPLFKSRCTAPDDVAIEMKEVLNRNMHRQIRI
ncbi:hypothetical protein CHS0354_014261 [Potamilus streckersoni]|uniref:TIR domain-containing protein n=1 Tax=Potamilus streckersoni TaxID=2493646 RepID=A0AAE0WA64_9BIVA|nr:hypothetical protein CHS0354_014261 [Potamilus streckersoni]